MIVDRILHCNLSSFVSTRTKTFRILTRFEVRNVQFKEIRVKRSGEKRNLKGNKQVNE
jgi:hypothetical protein